MNMWLATEMLMNWSMNMVRSKERNSVMHVCRIITPKATLRIGNSLKFCSQMSRISFFEAEDRYSDRFGFSIASR